MIGRRIKILSGEMAKARENMLSQELKEASRKHDFANAHKLSWRLARKQWAPKKEYLEDSLPNV